MDDPKEIETGSEEAANPLVEGRDFYLENGLMVLTRHYLVARGFCCKNGCRHCPYGLGAEQPLE